MDRARAYTAAVPGAISGSNGHGQTLALASALTNGFLLSEEQTMELMREWNATCQPPWKERELRHKVRESMKLSHQKPAGYLLGEQRQRQFRAPLVAPPAEKAVWSIKRRPTCETPSEESEIPVIAIPTTAGTSPGIPGDLNAATPEREGVSVESIPPSGLADDLVPLAVVPGCKIGRPAEILMADDDWRKLEASGFANEPMVQMAAALFGPCRVLETEGAR